MGKKEKKGDWERQRELRQPRGEKMKVGEKVRGKKMGDWKREI